MATDAEDGQSASPAPHVSLQYRSRMLEPAAFLLTITVCVGAVPYLYHWYYPGSVPPAVWIPAFFAPFIAVEAGGVVVAAARREYVADESGIRLLKRGQPTVWDIPWSRVGEVRHGWLFARRVGTPRPAKLRRGPYLAVGVRGDGGIIVGTWRFTITPAAVREATDATVALAVRHGIPVLEQDFGRPS